MKFAILALAFLGAVMAQVPKVPPKGDFRNEFDHLLVSSLLEGMAKGERHLLRLTEEIAHLEATKTKAEQERIVREIDVTDEGRVLRNLSKRPGEGYCTGEKRRQLRFRQFGATAALSDASPAEGDGLYSSSRAETLRFLHSDAESVQSDQEAPYTDGALSVDDVS